MTTAPAAAPGCGFDPANGDHQAALMRAIDNIRAELAALKETTNCSDQFLKEMIEDCIIDHLEEQG